MTRNLFPTFLILFSLAASAQQGTSSPYSFFGIGDIRFKGVAENRLMGGVSVFTDSIHANLQNPASYAGLKLTSFTIGGSFNATRLSSDSAQEKAQRTTLDYFAVGLPLGRKVGVGFGLIPYSSVGYRINSQQGDVIHKYYGNGGVNRVFLSGGYQLTPGLSIGADFNYNFGRVETTNINQIIGVQYGVQEFDNSELRGFNMNLGAMYQKKLQNKLSVFGSLTFSPHSILLSDNDRTVSLIQYNNDVAPSVLQQGDLQENTVKIGVPAVFSFGGGIGEERKWLLGGELALRHSSGFGDRFSDLNSDYENGYKAGIGGYFIPNYNSFTNYFSKVTYRAGLRFEKTGLILNGESIKDFAGTAGFGFPLGGTFSNLNAGVEIGRRGTAKANLVEEDYINLVISLSLNDKWFVRSKYD